MRHAVVIEAVRTPVGRAHPEKGIYRDVRADDLSADLMRALLERAGVPASEVEDVLWGCVKQQGEQGYDVARMAALIAGFPLEVGGVTVNRNCGSSLQAVNQAAQSIAADCEDVQIAGGVEHMQPHPDGGRLRRQPAPLLSPQPRHDEHGPDGREPRPALPISRREQDEFALRSHKRAARGDRFRRIRAGRSIPTWGRDEEGRRKVMTEDQCIRRDTTLEALGALKPAFMPEGGTVTAGNASPLNVGAAALLIMSEERAKELGLKPKVRIRSMAVAGVDPSVMGIGPVPATHKALERAGLKLEDIDLIELNEAFAAQALSVMKLLKADPEKVNVRGGAIAIGHPLGGSGARIATTLIHAMMDRKAKLGLATMCIGAGQGIATIFEAV